MRRSTWPVMRTWQATLEAQQVIGLRLARLAGGGLSAGAEATRMTSEKVAALGEVQTAAMMAVLTGKAAAVPSRTLALYRRKMRANRKRLTSASTMMTGLGPRQAHVTHWAVSPHPRLWGPFAAAPSLQCHPQRHEDPYGRYRLIDRYAAAGHDAGHGVARTSLWRSHSVLSRV
jgi:hypothetical protein